MNLSFIKDNFFIIIIGVLILIFIYIIFFKLKSKKSKKGKDLMETGIKVMGVISNVSPIKNDLTGQVSYIVTASFIYHDVMYEVKSDNLLFDANHIINTFFIKSLPIYFEQGNPQNNYLDISELEKYTEKNF